MAKKWRDLYNAIPTERRVKIEVDVKQDLAQMPLAEVRRARELTQQQIAKKLEVNQAWVSKVERQMDMYVSTLRSFIEAMGGELEIIARFNDGAVRLEQFEDLDKGAAGWSQSVTLEYNRASASQEMVHAAQELTPKDQRTTKKKTR